MFVSQDLPREAPASSQLRNLYCQSTHVCLRLLESMEIVVRIAPLKMLEDNRNVDLRVLVYTLGAVVEITGMAIFDETGIRLMVIRRYNVAEVTRRLPSESFFTKGEIQRHIL